ncbi:MAG: RES family NAD+ phosphorylase [Acidobacteria bacterium]|nr:RES family NAD+ phosphorylase [Acidobacteriota bacterium]
MSSALPRTSELRAQDTHRLIPSRFSDESVLARLTRDVANLQALFELDAATNARLHAETRGIPGIGPDELLANVPNAHIVNAAFCHPHPDGGRFNGPDRGAWYAGLAIETCQAEVTFHKQVQLDEIGWTAREVATYDDYLADISAVLHDLRDDPRFAKCLTPDRYVASQRLGARLLAHGALGLIYPSVRHVGGTCVACFRPAIVTHVRRGLSWRLVWDGGTLRSVARDRSRRTPPP